MRKKSTFSFGKLAGAAALRGFEIPRDFQQPQIALLTPHKDGSKPSWRCNHAVWCSVGRFSVGVASRTRFANVSCGILVTWQNNLNWNVLFGEETRL